MVVISFVILMAALFILKRTLIPTLFSVGIISICFCGILSLASFETVNTQEEMSHVSLGLPIPYFVQDQSRFDPPFPYKVSFKWETSIVQYFPSRLFINYIVIFSLTWLIILLCRSFVPSPKKKPHT